MMEYNEFGGPATLAHVLLEERFYTAMPPSTQNMQMNVMNPSPVLRSATTTQHGAVLRKQTRQVKHVR